MDEVRSNQAIEVPGTPEAAQRERRQWMLGHMATRSHEPLTPAELDWLAGGPRPELSEAAPAVEVYTALDEQELQAQAFSLDDVGSLDWLGWDEPELAGTRKREAVNGESRYATAIAAIPVLESADEKRLATQVQAGIRARTAVDEGRTDETLQAQIEAGNQAKETLWIHNLRLVPYIIRKYHLWNSAVGNSDLIQEGNRALKRSIENFDPDRKVAFATYTVNGIRWAIQRAVANESRTIRLPVHVHEQFIALNRSKAALCEDLEREPTAEELSLRLDQPIDRIRELDALNGQTVPLETMQAPDTFDADAFAEDSDNLPEPATNACLEAALEQVDTTDVEAEACQELLANDVWSVLTAGLRERERVVIALRYGFDSEPKTLEEIAEEFGVTRERIRQIEIKAFAKLRHPHHSEKLCDWIR